MQNRYHTFRDVGHGMKRLQQVSLSYHLLTAISASASSVCGLEIPRRFSMHDLLRLQVGVRSHCQQTLSQEAALTPTCDGSAAERVPKLAGDFW